MSMNKMITFAAVAASVMMFSSALAESITWTGVEDSNPLNANNWTNGAAEAVAPGTADTANIGDAPEAVLGGSAAWTQLKLGTEAGKTGKMTVKNGGALTLSSTLSFGNADGSAGVLSIDGGSIAIESLNTPNYAAISTMYLTSGTFTINNWADWGRNANGKAEFNQSGGTVTLKKGFQMGRDNNGTGTYNMSGGVLNGSSGDYFIVGRTGKSTGIFNLTDGTVNFGAKDVVIGGLDNDANGKGTKGVFTQSGGTVTANGNMHIGRYGTGTYTQSGGSLTCKNYFSIARFADSSGTYTITGGSFLATTQGIILGEQGTGTLTVGGTGVVSIPANGVYVGGNVVGAQGSLYLNGNGRIVAKYIGKGTGSVGAIEFNGGTLEAVSDNATFLNNLGSVVLGAGGVKIDSAGHDIGVSGCDFDETAGCSLVKKGAGTLTLAALPSAASVSVDAGTLALSASCDNSSASIAHRWSFTSNLLDSVTGKYGAKVGSGSVSWVEEGSGTSMRLPGGKRGTCHVNLGSNRLPSDSATIEAWVTLRELRNWTRLFRIGGQDDGTGNPTTFISRNASGQLSFDSIAGTQTSDKILEKDVQYYVAFTYAPDGNGGVVTKRYIKKVGDDDYLWINTATKANWSVSGNSARGTFWLGYSDYTDYDAKADYDEVRVWNGTLSDEAIALSVEKGPDATAEDIAEIAAAATDDAVWTRTLSVASGASFDAGAGNTLRQPILDAGGTLAGGSLVVTKRVNATVGETMVVASGATLDLTGAEIAVTNPEALTKVGCVFASSSEGGIVAASPRKLGGTLAGYTLYLTPTKARIGKPGFMLVVR